MNLHPLQIALLAFVVMVAIAMLVCAPMMLFILSSKKSIISKHTHKHLEKISRWSIILFPTVIGLLCYVYNDFVIALWGLPFFVFALTFYLLERFVAVHNRKSEIIYNA